VNGIGSTVFFAFLFFAFFKKSAVDSEEKSVYLIADSYDWIDFPCLLFLWFRFTVMEDSPEKGRNALLEHHTPLGSN